MYQRTELHRFRAAFTLVELMVAIVIVIVLAALSFSVTRNVKRRASAATSVSNLRQIGTAILTHASDNNNRLPGPVLTDQFPRYQNNAISGQLGWLLQDYLTSIPQPDNSKPRMFYTPGLDYPAARANAENPASGNKPTYVVFAKHTDADGETFWPLGNYNKNSSGERTSAMTTTQLASKRTRGKPWITETDQLLRPSTARYGAENEPVHGRTRNTLMFDFTVQAIPVGDF